MPEKDVASQRATELIRAFVAAGHQATKSFACDRCGTTLYDFAKKGRLPCLVTS